MTLPSHTRPVLRALKLTLTEACNLACPYCYQRDHGAREMSLDTLKASLDLTHRLGHGEVKVVLSGGEPLLATHLVETILDAAEESKIGGPRLRIRLISNGTLLRPSLLERLVETDISLQISCDGVTAAQNARAPESWLNLNHLLETIRRRYPRFWRRRLSVAMTITPTNVKHLASSIAWALSLQVRQLVVGPAFGLMADWGAQACAVLESEMAHVFELSKQHLHSTELLPITYLRPRSEIKTIAPDACGAADPTTLAVSVDGSVHGCSLLADVARWHPSAAVHHAARSLEWGNVADPDLEKSWRMLTAKPPQVVFPRAGRSALAGSCGDCSQREECLVCPVAGPDPRRVPDAHCLFQKLIQQQQKQMPQISPVEKLLNEAGVPAPLSAQLDQLVWQARQKR